MIAFMNDLYYNKEKIRSYVVNGIVWYYREVSGIERLILFGKRREG